MPIAVIELAGHSKNRGRSMQKTIVNGFDITSYAPPPHAEIVSNQSVYIEKRLVGISDFLLSFQIRQFIVARAPYSPLTGKMFLTSRDNHQLGNPAVWLAMALIQQDTMYGTLGEGADLHNPGNVGDDDDGHTRDYGTWENGVDAVFKWLARHKGSV
jgi:hypothetical protein